MEKNQLTLPCPTRIESMPVEINGQRETLMKMISTTCSFIKFEVLYNYMTIMKLTCQLSLR